MPDFMQQDMPGNVPGDAPVGAPVGNGGIDWAKVLAALAAKQGQQGQPMMPPTGTPPGYVPPRNTARTNTIQPMQMEPTAPKNDMKDINDVQQAASIISTIFGGG
jgi:hypothetical protein